MQETSAFANTQQWELEYLTTHIKIFCDQLRRNEQALQVLFHDLKNISHRIKRSTPKGNTEEFSIEFMQKLSKQIIQSAIDLEQYVSNFQSKVQKRVQQLSKQIQIIRHYRTNLQSMCVTAIKNNLYAEKRKNQLEQSKKSVDLKLDQIKYKIDNTRITAENKNKLLLTKTLKRREEESQFLTQEIKYLEGQRATIRQQLKTNTYCSENRTKKTIAYFNTALKSAKSNILKQFHNKNEIEIQFSKMMDNNLTESVEIDSIEPIPEIESEQDLMEQYEHIEKTLLANIESLNLGPEFKNLDIKKFQQATVKFAQQSNDKKQLRNRKEEKK